jgi:hypothetical protein
VVPFASMIFWVVLLAVFEYSRHAVRSDWVCEASHGLQAELVSLMVLSYLQGTKHLAEFLGRLVLDCTGHGSTHFTSSAPSSAFHAQRFGAFEHFVAGSSMRIPAP